MIVWWKISAVVLILYIIVAGFLFPVPALPILHESIRNLYFHVPMWFGMIILMTVSFIYSIRHLSGYNLYYDLVACEAANTGIFFGLLGITTGSIWARFTWGAWWVNDPKLNGAVASLLTFLAYFVLRNSLSDPHRKARIAAIYNIFAYSMMVVFLLILPRITDSLHPGSGGNPGFGTYDISNSMRIVFYPAVIGWALLGVWLMTIRIRIRQIKINLEL